MNRSYHRNQYSLPNWDDKKDKELTRLYPIRTLSQLAAHFMCGERTITRNTRRLGLLKPGHFSAAEAALIAEHYPTTGTSVLLGLLPGRQVAALHNYARRVGIKREVEPWTPRLDAQLAELCAQGVTFATMEQQLGRIRGALANRMQKLGLTKQSCRGKNQQGDTRPLSEAKERTPRPPRAAKPVKEKIVRVPKVKPPKPEKAPVMKVVRQPEPKPDYRSTAKVPCGKKRTTVPFESTEKLSDYLKGKPATHEHRMMYERLTRPGQPRRVLRTLADLLAAYDESTPLNKAA